MNSEELYLEMRALHPALFSASDKDRLGFCFGIGWVALVRDLMGALADLRRKGSFRVVQVKEKFGTLRVYVAMGEESPGLRSEVYHVLAMFEGRSTVTCERCGSGQGVLLHEPWDRVRCPKCQLFGALED